MKLLAELGRKKGNGLVECAKQGQGRPYGDVESFLKLVVDVLDSTAPPCGWLARACQQTR